MMIRRFLALAVVAFALAACSSGNAADATADGGGGELQATDWVLDSYAVNGALTIVPPDQYADADFRANRVKGFAGCNDYDAVYVSNGRGLFVGMPITTVMSCGETADAFQGSFITLLLQSRYYNVRGDTLTIRGADLSILLVFDAAPKNPLLGSWVVGLQLVPGSVHHERGRRGHRTPGGDPDRLSRGRHGPGTGVPPGHEGRRATRAKGE